VNESGRGRHSGARSAMLGALFALGCGQSLAPAFDARFPDDEPARIDAVRARLAAAAAGSERDPALLLASTHAPEPELLAYDLSAAALRWRIPFRSDSRAELLGDLVLGSAGGRLVAFDANTGRPRFSAALAECAYGGAARAGARLFVVCLGETPQGGEAHGRVLALDATSGRTLWERRTGGALGRPAAGGGLLFVPFRKQNLVVLDAERGTEIARVRIRDDVVDWVMITGGRVLFGHNRVHVIGPDGEDETVGRAAIDTRALPGSPPLWPSGFEPHPAARSARGRVALYLTPELVDGVVRPSHDRYYAVFYRYVFAYDTSGELRWAHMLPHDAIAGHALASGLALVTDPGAVWLLPRDGGTPQLRAELGLPLASAELNAADLAATPGGAAQALRSSLAEIALDTDNRLVPARAHAVAQLARLDDPEVTRDLLDVYGASATPPELKRAIASALRERRAGLEHLVDALLARYDFLEQTRPAPLAVIVPALVEARETRAVPHLVARLFDHETPISVLPAIATALAELGGEQAVEPLLEFARRYRADSSFAAHPEAILAAVQGVLANGGERGSVLLTELTADGRALPALTAGIRALLTPVDAAPGDTDLAANTEAEPELPAWLGDDAVRATFAEHTDDLRACIIDELGRNPALSQVRLAAIAEGDGSTHAWSFVPNTPQFVDCMYAKAAQYRFPRFRAARRVVKYVIAVRANEPPPPPSDQGELPWWQPYASRARSVSDAAPPDPWWRSHQPLAPLSLSAKPVSLMPAPERAPAGPAAPAAAAAPEPPATPAATAAPAESSSAPPAATPTPTPEAEDAWWIPSPASR
jgi:hypothetical protein